MKGASLKMGLPLTLRLLQIKNQMVSVEVKGWVGLRSTSCLKQESYRYIKQSVTFRFQNFSICLWYRYRFSKKFGIKKKYRYRFRKILVSTKVSVSVSKFFGIKKSISFGFEKMVLKKYESVSKLFHFF